MFKKSNRLTKSEFEEYYKIGRKIHLPHLTIVIHKIPTLKTAVVAGKKVAKSAVRRNTLKRRVNAILRKQVTKDLGVLIIILKPSFNSLPRKTAEEFVQQSIAQVLKGA